MIERSTENTSFSASLVDPKIVLENYHGQKNSPFGFPKSESDPKIKKKSNVRTNGNLENKSCSTT